MKHYIYATLTLLVCQTSFAKAPTTDTPTKPESKVQIALLLDTSNSMDGLIDQAKTQLWKVVNTFADAQHNGETPFVEVALYEYGNNALSVETNYIRQVQPFTRDLDEVSKQLFALSTNGGEEYCGAVIQRALADLQWSKQDNTYKVIFIAGNEPFTQGPINAHKACSDGFAKGITVNTVHCGSRKDGIAGQWHDGAALASGKFMIIDQDKAVVHIDAPQDKRIIELNQQLNATYITYGKNGWSGKQKQLTADAYADANAKSGAALQRSIAKATKSYCNSTWDLVDAVTLKEIQLTEVKKEDLPKDLQQLTPQQLQAKVTECSKKRTSIQAEIQKLNREREAFVANERKKLADSSTLTLDQALILATREQATKKGYTFRK